MAALVLGIVGLATSPLAGWNLIIAVPCNLLAIIFGSAAGARARDGFYGGEAQAKAGRMCGTIGFIIIAAWIALTIGFGFLRQQNPFLRYYELEQSVR